MDPNGPPLHLHPDWAREEVHGRVWGWGQESGCGSRGNQNPAARREEELKGGARRGNRKEAGAEGCRAAEDPSADPTPGPRLGREGAAREKEVELTPRSSSERKSGPSSRPSCGVSGAPHAGGEDGVGETQSETLVPGRRGPHTRPQPAVPTARPGIGAAGEHPPSWLLRGEVQRRRAPRRGSERLAAAGAGPRSSPAPRRRGGLGSASPEAEGRPLG